MKMAEFLNLDTKQVQWFDASLEHPNLVKVPKGAVALVLYGNASGYWFNGDNKYKGFGSVEHIGDFGNSDVSSYKSIHDYVKFVKGDIIWQRNPLQQKINETLSILNVSKAQLSVLLGREKSYVKRLLAKGRNVTENTKLAVIDQLEQLIRVHEYETTEDPVKDTIDQEAIIAKLNLQLHTTSKLLDQAVAEKNVWRLKLQDQRNLSWFLTLVVVVMAFVWIYSVWGV